MTPSASTATSHANGDGWFALDAAASAPVPLYDVAAIRRIENAAFTQLPAFTLMSRAGAAAARWLACHAPAGPLLFLAGPGNNGGDALVAATQLHSAGRAVQVWLTADPQHLPADAATAWQQAHAAGVPVSVVAGIAASHDADWPAGTAALVDGLLGIGLNRPADGTMAWWIGQINRSALPVFALDIPSGLFADTGAGAPAVRAQRTLTFIAAKPGLLTLDGRDCAGEVDIAPIGLDYPPDETPHCLVNGPALFSTALPRRHHASNKGTHGSLALIGGNLGMTGAPLLGARAAQFLGAGKVHIGFLAQPAPLFDPLHPELMLHAVDALALAAMSALVIGPGMGTDANAHKQFARLLQAAPLPLVLDADALNLLAADPALAGALAASGAACVITPHPLEAARLMGVPVAEVQRDRPAAAAALAAQWQAVVVLKGSGTVIAAPDGSPCTLNPSGNAALASAGTGDVLAGMLGALLAQGMAPLAAARAAVWIHGRAADALVAQGTGPAGVTASELYAPARTIFNQLLAGARA
ncbi:bifunctional ADP-dependent (S)-NAD(P)H-hydrate dehydratase/NAD(P)H-hydrate epimerase [Cupriavidus necator]|uniref:bifunctional ADP-dependent NAD(P)H-hydrate dehydratase/NAD(P)H-hydrate epimerase n=1 Tax=Cupriavidus TaxID=106589 RepID=UPI00032D9CBA|nr:MULTISPECIES: bifunctional ADP-dependent NAD(P)H-hydrate dehydratase/NAD(P)H-hydrate epimerase [Cupriavidus]EON20480.1 sugar kinase [Cupriavidus sp. GA3-3]KUE88740.1 bifunctional ADP-dependent (S)-NAD(P)H-hydrate dehydratase/NAD(P)H-hydrate epimerase [Cupriavidus necator]